MFYLHSSPLSLRFLVCVIILVWTIRVCVVCYSTSRVMYCTLVFHLILLANCAGSHWIMGQIREGENEFGIEARLLSDQDITESKYISLRLKFKQERDYKHYLLCTMSSLSNLAEKVYYTQYVCGIIVSSDSNSLDYATCPTIISPVAVLLAKKSEYKNKLLKVAYEKGMIRISRSFGEMLFHL